MEFVEVVDDMAGEGQESRKKRRKGGSRACEEVKEKSTPSGHEGDMSMDAASWRDV